MTVNDVVKDNLGCACRRLHLIHFVVVTVSLIVCELIARPFCANFFAAVIIEAGASIVAPVDATPFGVCEIDILAVCRKIQKCYVICCQHTFCIRLGIVTDRSDRFIIFRIDIFCFDRLAGNAAIRVCRQFLIIRCLIGYDIFACL